MSSSDSFPSHRPICECQSSPTPKLVLPDVCSSPPLRRTLRSFLHEAVAKARFSQVRILIDKLHENVNAKDVYGRTPLMLTCLIENERCGYAIARLLLSRGAQVDETDQQSRTALHYACLGAREAIVSRLLVQETIRLVKTRDVFGYTPLMYAAMRCSSACGRSSASVVRTLIHDIYDGASVDEMDALGYTPLLMACRYRNWAAAQVLLDEGHAEIRLRDHEFQYTAIEWVMCSEEPDDGGCRLGGHRTTSIAVKDRRRESMSVSNLCKMNDGFKPCRCQQPPVRKSPPRCFCGDQLTFGVSKMIIVDRTSGNHRRGAFSVEDYDENGPQARDFLIATIQKLYLEKVVNRLHLNCAEVLAAPVLADATCVGEPLSGFVLEASDVSAIPSAASSKPMASLTSNITIVVPPATPPRVASAVVADDTAAVEPKRPAVNPPTPDLIALCRPSHAVTMEPSLSELFHGYLPDQFTSNGFNFLPHTSGSNITAWIDGGVFSATVDHHQQQDADECEHHVPADSVETI